MSIPANIPAGFNVTLLNNTDLCTLSTCPLSLGHVEYLPNLGGNVFYIAIFALALAAQIFLTVKFKTFGYGIAMFGGLVLEIIGYTGRVQMHYNPFQQNPFLMYLVCLTIGPAFLSAAVYLCLSRIVVVYSESVSLLRPATYTLVFITCDFIALLLQAAGGAIASTATTVSLDNVGKNIMIAGVSCSTSPKAAHFELDPEFASFRQSKLFKSFLWSLGTATLTIFIRSVFRCAELSGGFHGKLANQQITFMILEGAMIAIACICLTVFHPGVVFKETWHVASWSIRAKHALKTSEETKPVDPEPFPTSNVEMQSVPSSATKLGNAHFRENS